MWANERNDASIGKARVSCPANTIGSGVIKAAPGFDQHVQAHQKSGQMDSTGVIDQKFIDDQRTPFVERGIVDDFEHIYPNNPILYVTEVHERLAREPLTASRAKFEWSELNIFDVAGPT